MTSSDEHVDVAALAHQGGAGVVSVQHSEAGGSSEAERISQLHDAWSRGWCQSAGVDLLEPEGRCSSACSSQSSSLRPHQLRRC